MWWTDFWAWLETVNTTTYHPGVYSLVQLFGFQLALSAPPIVIAFVVSLPIAWVANRFRASRGVILTISGILYAIPSLPLFIALPSIIATKVLDPINVVVALSLYGVALMVRTSADALDSVSGDVKQSATAIGFSGVRGFFSVELPLAGPVLLAGLRVVSVSTVSLVSIGSLIGVPSLGSLFTDGYSTPGGDINEILIGIVGTIIVAILFDLILVGIGRVLMPWTRSKSVTVPLSRTPKVQGAVL
jgi:osmoprotectant transport system permease protein